MTNPVQLSMDTLAVEKTPTNYFEALLHHLSVRDDVPGWTNDFGLALHTHMKRQQHKSIKTLSLFSGGGGLDIAFHDAGFDIVQMVEVNPHYVETLSANCGQGGNIQGVETVCMDICNFQPPDNLDIDFIIGGPPCQTFSAAGRRAAGVAGFDDPRGMLFLEYVRLLEQLQPAGFLFENVYGITGAQGGKPWQEIISAFSKAGYYVYSRILDTADYGVPQHRERLIIVGVHEGTFHFPRPTHGPDSSNNHPYYTAGLALQEIDDEKPVPVGGRYGHLLKDIPPGLNYSFYTEEMGHPEPVFAWRSKFSDLLYKADPEKPVRTLKAQVGQYTGPFHWDNRPLSIGELKRLQTIPDDYQMIGGRGKVIEQIGNSVPPQFARMLALAVLDQLFGISLGKPIAYLDPGEKLGFRSRKRAVTAYYQQKAQQAIAKLSPLHSPDGQKFVTPTKQYQAYLGPHFEWYVEGYNKQQRNWNVLVEVQNGSSLAFHVGNGHSDTTPVLVIEIRPVNSWIVPVPTIQISVQSWQKHVFTASWKALEYYLASEGLKADLVQLRGYYQYASRITMQVVAMQDIAGSETNVELWNVVKQVIEGQGVGSIVTMGELATLWKVSEHRMKEFLLGLRELGYEVRSYYTNNQIPQGAVLIPYAFPTLNPKSVQLRKSLFPLTSTVHEEFVANGSMALQ